MLLKLQGDGTEALERSVKKHLYGLGGWMTIWKYGSLAAKVYRRDVVHSWNTQDGRLSWMEHCARADTLSTCFEVEEHFSLRGLERAKDQWLRWEKVSILRVISP